MVTIVDSAATPMVPPSWRETLLTPLATPAEAGGLEDSTTDSVATFRL